MVVFTGGAKKISTLVYSSHSDSWDISCILDEITDFRLITFLRERLFVLIIYSIWKLLYTFLKHRYDFPLFCTQNCTNVKCILISCTVGQLERGKSAALKIRSRLWAQTFLEVMHTKIFFYTHRPLHLLFDQIFKNTNEEIKWAKYKSFLLSLSLKITSQLFLFRSHTCCLLFFFSLSLPLKFMSWILPENSKIIFKQLSWFCFCFPGLAQVNNLAGLHDVLCIHHVFPDESISWSQTVYGVHCVQLKNCYSLSINLGTSNMYQARITYNTHVVTICVLTTKKKGQCRPLGKWTSLCKFLHFQLHLLSEMYLHCIRQRDCTVSCYLTAGHMSVVRCGCHIFNTGQYIEKFIIQFAVTRKEL